MGHALLGWIVVIIPASVVLTLALLPVFTLLKRRYATCTSAKSTLQPFHSCTGADEGCSNFGPLQPSSASFDL